MQEMIAVDYSRLEEVGERPFVCSSITPFAIGEIILCVNTEPRQAYRVTGVATHADYERQWGVEAANAAYENLYFVEALD